MSNEPTERNLSQEWNAGQDRQDIPNTPWQGGAPAPWQGSRAPWQGGDQRQTQAGSVVAMPSHGAVASTASAGAPPVGKIRNTGPAIALMIVTFGLYGLYWSCSVHNEMKRHANQGVGGVGAFFLAFVPLVLIFLTPAEVAKLYVRQNRQSPVSAMTGFWTLIPVVGGLLWFAQVNGALNDYWRSVGAGQQR